MSTGILDAQNLSKVVGDAGGELAILHSLSLDLAHGNDLTTIDSSSSDKSTLLGLLTGLDQPSDGEIRLTGHALGDLDEDQRTHVRVARVGFVFQSFQLLDSLDALENVMLPLELKGRTDARQRARGLLERVGLDQHLGHYPRQLPSGEQQRVTIVRTFAAEPDILFADRPTGNLGSATGERVSNLFFELNRERDTTLVLVTYDERLAYRYRRLVRLESGHLINRVEP